MLEIRFQQARDNLKRQIAILSLSVATLEESIAILESELDLLSHPGVETESPPFPAASADGPKLDVGTLSVEFEGKRCQLGNNLKFKLLARLLRRHRARRLGNERGDVLCPSRTVSARSQR